MTRRLKLLLRSKSADVSPDSPEEFNQDLYNGETSKKKIRMIPSISISEEAIFKRIKKIRKNSSPGPSGITPIFLKTFAGLMSKILAREYKQFIGKRFANGGRKDISRSFRRKGISEMLGIGDLSHCLTSNGKSSLTS